jgi:hypothetical protein
MVALWMILWSVLGIAQGPFRQPPRELADLAETRVFELVPDLALGSNRLREAMGENGIVIVIRRADCPVAKRYLPVLDRLETDYRARGVPFVSVDVDEPEGASVARSLGALTTPEVFFLDRARTLRYRGAIDDQYGIGYSKAAPTATYLVDALEAVLEGKDVLVEATASPGCVLGLEGGPSAELETITYHNRVSRILQRRCQECHRGGGAGPFPLESFEDAKDFSAMIAFVVEKEIMPPWFADPETGHWANDRSLSERDRRALLEWVSNEAPEGDAADAPLPRQWVAGWSMGEPDAVVEIPEPFDVPAEGVVDYQYVYVKTDFPEDRWIQKMEILPTAPKVTHHVLVFLEEPGRKSIDDENRKPGEPFFQGGLSGYFASTVPGQQPAIYPPGMAKRLPKGAWLKFQIHYTPNGEPATDRTRIGFVFADAPPRTTIETGAAFDTDFEIPPGARKHEVEASFRFEKNAVLLSFFPHMHLRGKAYRYELHYPDGESQVLLSVPRYDFNWQLHYQFEEPLEIPAGSVLEATGWFDNSAENPANPDSGIAVRFGEQSFEEMMIGYFDYYVR